MVDLARPAHPFLDLARRLVRETQEPEIPCLIVGGRGARIMAEPKRQIAMRNRIVAIVGLRHQSERLFEVSFMKALQTEHPQPNEARSRLGLLLGESSITPGEL